MEANDIVKEVRDYLMDDLDNYAIMINGGWGSGKTYLYENYLRNAINQLEVGKNEGKSAIYISLYGMKTIEELANELFANYIMFSKLHAQKKSKKDLEKAGTVISMITKSVTINVPFVGFDVKKLVEETKGLIEIKNLVVCLDDFERCEIPINTLLGYINSLVEHQQCKVIILADESNIGKINANINLEAKYATLLTGNRKIVFEEKNIKDGKVLDNEKSELTISQLKKYNEKLYSDNYLYRDIKEKVVRRTYLYRPDIFEVLLDISKDGDGKRIRRNEYRLFINKNAEKISTIFRGIQCENLRIIFLWIKNFELIYLAAEERISDYEYYEYIIDEFMRYSIWKLVSRELNRPLLSAADGGKSYIQLERDEVYFEENNYNTCSRYRFIDPWIISGIKDEKSLIYEAKQIQIHKRKEELYEKKRTGIPTGKALGELMNAQYMSDESILYYLDLMLNELKNDKYIFDNYGTIINILDWLKNDIDFHEINIDEYFETMKHLIEVDKEVYDMRFVHWEKTNSDAMLKELIDLRAKRNAELDASILEVKGAYESVERFCDECKLRSDYFIQNNSFMDCINIKSIIELLKIATLKEIYDINNAFEEIYYMGNVKEFFASDLVELKKLEESINSIEIEMYEKGRTYKYAIKNFENTILDIIKRLK